MRITGIWENPAFITEHAATFSLHLKVTFWGKEEKNGTNECYEDKEVKAMMALAMIFTAHVSARSGLQIFTAK